MNSEIDDRIESERVEVINEFQRRFDAFVKTNGHQGDCPINEWMNYPGDVREGYSGPGCDCIIGKLEDALFWPSLEREPT